jgi:hypothetical protein
LNLDELFYGNNDRVKNFADMLAEALEDYWFGSYVQTKRQKLITVFTAQGWDDILEMLKNLYVKLNISQLIADNIRTHVDGYRNIEDVYEMTADISAEIFNKFITSVGQVYFTPADIADLKQANNKVLENANGEPGLKFDLSEFDFKSNSREEAAVLISRMANLSELLQQRPLTDDAKRLPNIRNYSLWYHKLKVGFVFACDIPNYDVEANARLKLIIDKVKAIKN